MPYFKRWRLSEKQTDNQQMLTAFSGPQASVYVSPTPLRWQEQEVFFASKEGWYPSLTSYREPPAQPAFQSEHADSPSRAVCQAHAAINAVNVSAQVLVQAHLLVLCCHHFHAACRVTAALWGTWKWWMKVSPLPRRGAEWNWKIVFIPPVCRHRIRFVYNWFKLGEGGKAEVSLLMDGMIEFVSSRAPSFACH